MPAEEAVVGREAPEIKVGFSERHRLSDVGDREAQSVVGGGAHRHRDRNRDVQDRHDEGKARGFFGTWFDDIDRGKAHQVIGVAFVVGVDDDVADLGV